MPIRPQQKVSHRLRIVLSRLQAAVDDTAAKFKVLCDLLAKRNGATTESHDCSEEEAFYVAALEYEISLASQLAVAEIFTQIAYDDWQNCLNA